MKKSVWARYIWCFAAAIVFCFLVGPGGAAASAKAAETGVLINEENFPDEAFRNILLEWYDEGNDGTLTEELTQVTDISLSTGSVTDVTGIKYFTNLERLNLYGNCLTALDVSGCTKLQRLDCSFNDISELNVSGCTNLKYLTCGNNNISSLDVSDCVNLISLSCEWNNISILDVQNCSKMMEIECNYNNLSSLKVSGLEELLLLDCFQNNLSSLDVDGCKNLKYLTCYCNQLVSLDVSGLEKLEDLDCNTNELVSLDVSGCEKLQYLDCYGNYLSSLELSGCANIKEVLCYTNELSDIVVDDCETLELLNCSWNCLSSLDVSSCTGLTVLNCEWNEMTDLDISGCTSLETLIFSRNKVNELDVTGCTALKTLECTTNELTVLELHELTELEKLNCAGNNISVLDVSACTELKDLNCNGNGLKSLDVSALEKLEKLQCYNNELICLDVTNCEKLKSVSATANQRSMCCIGEGFSLEEMPEFDASRTSNWEGADYDPDTNTLENVTEKVLYDYDCGNGFVVRFELLEEGPVDKNRDKLCDVCSKTIDRPYVVIDETSFPDEVFRQVLLERYDYGQDGVLINELNKKSINVNSDGVSDLRGIENFVYLETLSCSNNNLSKLDLSWCTTLKSLDCSMNGLKVLDVSTCKGLEELSCDYNEIKRLNISGCTKLRYLGCDRNKLSELNVNDAIKLVELSCRDNLLSALDTSRLVNLELLYCSQNELASLTVGNDKLRTLYCDKNKLEELRLYGCEILEVLDCSQNKLKSLDVSGCINLKELDCGTNELKNLTMLKCSSLEVLDCTWNGLSSLDVWEKLKLKTLWCGDNIFQSLDVSEYVNLESLNCDNNQLSSLDVSKCTKLIFLSCNGNDLSCLDVSKCEALQELYAEGNQTQVCNLDTLRWSDLPGFLISKAINWEGAEYSEQVDKLYNITGPVSYDYDCGNGFSARFELIEVGEEDKNHDKICDICGKDIVGPYVIINEENFPDEVFRNILLQEHDKYQDGVLMHELDETQFLVLSGKGISDLTGIEWFTKLEDLWCDGNKLESLNLETLTSLRLLVCAQNQLSSLDLSNCTKLDELICTYNKLSSLDLSGLTELRVVWCYDNQICDMNVSGCTSLKNIWCDANELSELNIKDLINLESLTCRDNKISGLDFNGLTKIKDLDCSGNLITALDLDGLVNLKTLDCSDNKLDELNLTGLTRLEYVDCSQNNISHLYANGYTGIKVVNCSHNRLSKLNLDGALILEQLDCSWNNFHSLDVNQYTNLDFLNCGYNYLTQLDISGLLNLEMLGCTWNNLYCMDVSNSPKLSVFEIRVNEWIACVGESLELSELPGFDISKVSELSGAVYDAEKDALVGFEDGAVITYLYDCGGGYIKDFTLRAYYAHSDSNADGKCDFCTAYIDAEGNIVDPVEAFVERMYTLIMNRPADSGLAYWVGELKTGAKTGAEVAAGFVLSEEFLGKEMTNAEYIGIMYQTFFGREADEGGLAWWLDAMENGTSKQVAFAGFVNSDEFEEVCAEYGITRGTVTLPDEQGPEEPTVSQFVKRLYSEIMGRDADESGLSYWVGELEGQRTTGAEAAAGFILSEEFQAKEMTNAEYIGVMYRTFFGRDADEGGLTWWLDAMENGESKWKVFAGFANSDEFGTLCETYGIIQGSITEPTEEPGPTPTPEPTVSEFVKRLYSEIMGRDADEGGLSYWVGELEGQKQTGAEAAAGFILSEEFQTREMTNAEYIRIMYRTFFGRDADEGGLAWWLDAMENGTSKFIAFAGFANSDEFGELCEMYGITQGEVPVE